MNSKNLLIALLIGAGIAAGLFVATKMKAPTQPQFATMLTQANALPDFSLLDQKGNPVNADTFRGQWDLVFFGFAHCPDICPITLQTLSNAKRALIDSGARVIPRIVLVSVDPERDTPDILGKYVAYFGDDNLAVTGDLEQLRRLTSALGIYFEKIASDNENYAVDHSAAVLVIDPNGQFSALFGAPHAIENYLHDFPIIVATQ